MKKVLITGASSGLGRHLTDTFLGNGYQVITLGRHVHPNNSCIHYSTDLSDQAALDATMQDLLVNHQDLSCVICCAGIGYIEGVDHVDYAHTEEMFQVNLIGHSYLLSSLAEIIKTNHTDLVFVGATIGYKANEHMPLYSVTKWGLRGLVENWRNYLKPYPSRVLHISPGGMDTESNIGPQGRETIIAQKTGKAGTNFLDTATVAEFIYTCISLPKNMELAEVIINRK